jgi:GNAT superfamily N-acetyltransferase
MSIPIRPALESDAPGIAHVHVASWRSTYAGLMPADFLANLSLESRENQWRSYIANPNRKSEFFVAEDMDGQIIGFACGGPEREGHPIYKGELYAIYLLAEHQGKGIGRALMQAVVQFLLTQDLTTMLVWVLAGNPACGFYEAMGGVHVGSKPLEIGGETLEELAYGWADIRPIITGVTNGF